jgi:polysaccharide export outer membrane protein
MTISRAGYGSGILAACLLAALGGCGSTKTAAVPDGGTRGRELQPASPAVSTPVIPITPALVQQQKAGRDNAPGHDISGLLGQPALYGIEAGDQLSVVVWDHPELAGVGMPTGSLAGGMDPKTSGTPTLFTVDQQGAIQYPYLGSLHVAGMTEQQARDLLASKLSYYINKPNVTLSIQSYRGKRIYVDGEVKTPGLQAINDIPMNLIEALNRAGGFLASADQSRIALSRNGRTFRINLPELMERGVNPASLMLAHGDVLRIRSREESKVFISGEVIAPRALYMHNGRLSLNEALGESGGINPLSGDASQIYVIRKAPVTEVYQLNAQAPSALGLAEEFELEPKDMIYVAATPLANWYRTISQLVPGSLPAAAAFIPGR